MAKCMLCGKSSIGGMSVARTGTRGYVKCRTKRRFKPNIRRVKVTIGGTTQTLHICAQCLKSRIKAEKVAV